MKRAVLLFLSLPLACADPDEDARVNAATAQGGPEFRPVAQVVVDRCASLDCHGSKYRNMRLYGFGSARLDPTHRPDAPDTTQAEVDANYQAIVALEPDLFRRVVAEGGAAPERLTFFRKGQLLEAHKGAQRIVPGDAADRCVRSWLASRIDAEVCKSAVPRLNESP